MSFREQLIDSTQKPKATRLSFGECLADLGKSHENIVVLDADLAKSTQTQHFAKAFPERFFEMGIQEANMIGVAAGLALTNKIPFAASFAAFLTGRFDQVRMSVAFSNAPVKLVGTHAGVAIGEDGHSQMGLEDLTLMRSLPNMTVFQPADDWDTRQFMHWSLSAGPCYMRLTRQDLPALKRNQNDFSPGKWNVLRADASANVVLIGSGGVMEAAIDAADILAKSSAVSGIEIVNAAWIQPYDKDYLDSVLKRNGVLLVSVEDHYTVGGLGGLIAEHMSTQRHGAKLLRIGVEEFGQSGTPQENLEYYGFTGEKIAARVLKAIG